MVAASASPDDEGEASAPVCLFTEVAIGAFLFISNKVAVVDETNVMLESRDSAGEKASCGVATPPPLLSPASLGSIVASEPASDFLSLSFLGNPESGVLVSLERICLDRTPFAEDVSLLVMRPADGSVKCVEICEEKQKFFNFLLFKYQHTSIIGSFLISGFWLKNLHKTEKLQPKKVDLHFRTIPL